MTPARRRHLAMLTVFTNPVWQERMATIRKIADAVGAEERRFQRMIGAEWTDAYRADWATAEEVHEILNADARPDVLPRFRPAKVSYA